MKADSCDNLISIYSVVCAISNLPHALFLGCGSERRYGFKDSCGSSDISIWEYDPLISVWAKMAWILQVLYLRTFSWIKTPSPCLSIKTIFPGSRDSHYGDEMVMRLSYSYNENHYTGMTASLYWGRPQNPGRISLENSSLEFYWW